MNYGTPTYKQSQASSFLTRNTIGVYNPATNIYSAYDQQGNPINAQYLTNVQNRELAPMNDFENQQLQELYYKNPFAVQMRKAFVRARSEKMGNGTQADRYVLKSAPWLTPHPETLLRLAPYPPHNGPEYGHKQMAFADNPLQKSVRLQQPRSYQELVYMQKKVISMSRAGFVPENFPFPPPPLPFRYNMIPLADDSHGPVPMYPQHHSAVGDITSNCDAQTNAAGRQQSTAPPTLPYSDAMNCDGRNVPLNPPAMGYVEYIYNPYLSLKDVPLASFLRPYDIFSAMKHWTGGANILKEKKIQKLFGNIDCKLETKAWVIDTHRNAHTYFKKDERCMVSYISALMSSDSESQAVETICSTEPGASGK